MLRDELTELQFIAPIDNLASILQHGVLSHNQVRKLHHKSVAMQEIQDLRAQKVVPGGLALHDYGNLYIRARNPMMYKRKDQHESLCVLSISTAVLDIAGTVITDQNAAGRYVRFAASPEGLSHVNKDLTFARDWRHPDDQIAAWRHKAAKCAEVLVPNGVHRDYIRGIYVSGPTGLQRVQAVTVSKAAHVNADLFFQ